MKVIELPPIKESSEDFEQLEAALTELFKKNIYYPLLKSLKTPQKVLNSKSTLLDAIRSGRITYNKGQFSGRFNASISKELKQAGARWDRRTGTFRLPKSSLPIDLRNAISVSQGAFLAKIADLDKKLTQIFPAAFAESFNSAKFFDTALFKVDKDFRANVEKITVAPKLTRAQSKKITQEWQENFERYIKDFTQKEIKQLRRDIRKSVMQGDRYGSLVGTIQKSYGVSRNKAKFLARQETGLLMAKFKETRYTQIGSMEYKWGCVAGSPKHPVRTWHKSLEGKIFRWDDPPITTGPGEPIRKNNPGEDFNCRCFARPIIRIKD